MKQPWSMRIVLLGLLGAALVVTSIVAERTVGGSGTQSAVTTVCLGPDYSLQNGCQQAVHSLTQPQFGRAYVVTEVGERAGVEQYELFYRESTGAMKQLSVRPTSTSKVPRYVLNLADLAGEMKGPPAVGQYELVTQSGGKQSSYLLQVTEPAAKPSSTGSSTATTSPSPSGT